MKKLLLSVCLLVLPLTSHALSEEARQLKEKLSAVEQLNANFTQRVSSAEGKLLNESSGEMSISRPGKFHWQINTPEEELIVSNGQTIWYYSPFIEQVTLINFADAIDDTPFALIAGANEQQWEDYNVTKTGEQYVVSDPSKAQSSTIIVEFDKDNHIHQFVVIEKLGLRSVFLLSHQPLTKTLSDAFFEFQIPAGVEVDDQR